MVSILAFLQRHGLNADPSVCNVGAEENDQNGRQNDDDGYFGLCVTQKALRIIRLLKAVVKFQFSKE